MNKSLTYDEIERLAKSQLESKVECKHCNRKMLLGKRDMVICSWCKNYVFKDERTEMKYRIMENLNKIKINEKLEP